MGNVRWGILSTAGIAQEQLIPAFDRAENAEVVAIASSSGKAGEVAEQLGIPKAYDSYEQLLADPDIDGVYIPLPNHLHKKWVIEAAIHGKHILCEKPAALTSDEFEEMKQVCDRNNVLFMEAFMYLFHGQHQRVKEIIDSGEIGDVRFMRSAFSFFMEEKEGNIRMDATKGGGSLFDIGCYSIHSIRNVLGAEPVSVHCHAKVDPDYGVETDTVTFMEFASGVTAVFDSSFSYNFRHEYEVIGTKGHITVPRAYRPDVNGGEGLIIVEKGSERREETVNTDQYKAEVEHISEAILNDNKVMISAENTLNNLKVIEACLASIKQGTKVSLT